MWSGFIMLPVSLQENIPGVFKYDSANGFLNSFDAYKPKRLFVYYYREADATGSVIFPFSASFLTKLGAVSCFSRELKATASKVENNSFWADVSTLYNIASVNEVDVIPGFLHVRQTAGNHKEVFEVFMRFENGLVEFDQDVDGAWAKRLESITSGNAPIEFLTAAENGLFLQQVKTGGENLVKVEFETAGSFTTQASQAERVLRQFLSSDEVSIAAEPSESLKYLGNIAHEVR